MFRCRTRWSARSRRHGRTQIKDGSGKPLYAVNKLIVGGKGARRLSRPIPRGELGCGRKAGFVARHGQVGSRMQPAGRRAWLTSLPMAGRSETSAVDRARAPVRLHRRCGLPLVTAAAIRRFWSCSWRRHRRAVHRRRCRRSRPSASTFLSSKLEPGHREIRRAGADLRHDRHVVDRHGDRGAGRAADRGVPHRAVPAVAAPADRHRDRAARRHPRASSTASGACSCSRRSCSSTCSRS